MPLQLHKGNRYRIAWSEEEVTSLVLEGWTKESAEGVEYVPLSAVEREAPQEPQPDPPAVEPRRGPGRPRLQPEG